jgi:hypothetical protein
MMFVDGGNENINKQPSPTKNLVRPKIKCEILNRNCVHDRVCACLFVA